MSSPLIPNPARVLVTGGRDFTNRRKVEEALDRYQIAVLCNGGARGADALATCYALARGIPCVRMEPDWKTYGKYAGPMRNRQMLTEFKPDLLVAFEGGKGTMHMRSIAEAAGVPVYVVW